MIQLPSLPDEVFAFQDLKEDFSYAWISPAQREAYLSAALGAGRSAAANWRGHALDEDLARAGVAVRCWPDAPSSDIHSQILWDGGTHQIDIFLPTARAVGEAMAGTSCPLTPEQVKDAFLAHEFYHYLEYSTGHWTDELCPPVSKRIFGIFRTPAPIRRMSEIAAFAFSREFCGLPVHPKLMDYVLLYQRRGLSESELLGRMERLAAEYYAACGRAEEGLL